MRVYMDQVQEILWLPLSLVSDSKTMAESDRLAVTIHMHNIEITNKTNMRTGFIKLFQNNSVR